MIKRANIKLKLTYFCLWVCACEHVSQTPCPDLLFCCCQSWLTASLHFFSGELFVAERALWLLPIPLEYESRPHLINSERTQRDIKSPQGGNHLGAVCAPEHHRRLSRSPPKTTFLLCFPSTVLLCFSHVPYPGNTLLINCLKNNHYLRLCLHRIQLSIPIYLCC